MLLGQDLDLINIFNGEFMDHKTRFNLELISNATVSMQLLKRGIRNVFMAGPKPQNVRTKPIVGEAFTLRYVPMREDLSVPEVLGGEKSPPRLAIENTPAGAILVIDGRGRADIAAVGDILVERLKFRKVGGIVSDGGIRDYEECLAADFPIYAAGPASPASIHGHSAADLQTPIQCGGVAVFPGDIIKGDGDGVMVIPHALAKEVAHDGVEQERYERFAKEQVSQGAKVTDVYPATKKSQLDYNDWLQKGEPND